MEANDRWGGTIADHMGIIGKIYIKLQIKLLYTKYRSFGSCGFRDLSSISNYTTHFDKHQNFIFVHRTYW